MQVKAKVSGMEGGAARIDVPEAVEYFRMIRL